ncbi:hypothetical protein [Noviherbaspirillum pedocola]|uniref:SCP domain-containing protein n=1 Tax=Noviherbaspirillum pedocola TaxID=2801341 RepID=A0A934SYI1_9BURK|nr:hypothetical protein [Noviherbaspirillum pedocola]MBK4737928.1 hypothetical protein [Noviherbaspirillum pedocola]
MFNTHKAASFTMKQNAVLVALLAGLALSGCGGGGGGDSSGSSTSGASGTSSTSSNAGSGSNTPSTVTLASAIAVDPVTSVPAATYQAGSEEAQIFQDLNNLRGAMGIGLLQQNLKLDFAAGNHRHFLESHNLYQNATYLHSTFNGILGPHYEDAALLGFTGQAPADRAVFAQYTGTVAENVTVNTPAGQCVSSLANTVYHLISLVNWYREVGISVTPGKVCTIELGHDAANGMKPQLPKAGSVSVLPANGQTGVDPTFFNQMEVPTPAADIGAGTGVGHPVLVNLYSQGAETLAPTDIGVISFSLTRVSDGAKVDARILTAPGVLSMGAALTSDANITSNGNLVLLPTSPLDAGTTYKVTFVGAVKQSPVAKTWTFSTK